MQLSYYDTLQEFYSNTYLKFETSNLAHNLGFNVKNGYKSKFYYPSKTNQIVKPYENIKKYGVCYGVDLNKIILKPSYIDILNWLKYHNLNIEYIECNNGYIEYNILHNGKNIFNSTKVIQFVDKSDLCFYLESLIKEALKYLKKY